MIACHELLSRLGDERLVVVDCREVADWDRLDVQIPGAVRMTPRELADEGRALPDDELIVLCGCARGLDDARRAWRVLRRLGREACCLQGGLIAWVAAGLPTERPRRSPAGRASGGDVTACRV